MQVKRCLSIFFLFLILTACSKNGSGEKDREPPVVTITSLAPGDIIQVGAARSITGQIVDADRLVEVHIHITNMDNGSLIADIHRYPGGTSYQVSESFTPNTAAEYRIQIIAKDKSLNEGRATVMVIAQ